MMKITTKHSASSHGLPVAIRADGKAMALRELPWHQLLDCIEGPSGGEGPDTTHPAVRAEIARRIAYGESPGHGTAPELSYLW